MELLLSLEAFNDIPDMELFIISLAEDLDDLEPYWKDINDLEVLLDKYEQEMEKPLIRKPTSQSGKYASWKEWRANWKSLRDRMGHYTYTLAVVDGRVIGFVLVRDDTDYVDTGSVEIISVLPEFRGRGVGARLMVSAKKYLKSIGCKYVILGVNSTKPAVGVNSTNPAVRLYNREGFEPYGIRMFASL